MAGIEVNVVAFSFSSIVATSGAIYVYTVSMCASSIFIVSGASLNSDVSVIISIDQATHGASPTTVSGVSYLYDAPCEVVAHKFILHCLSNAGEMVNSQVSFAL